MMNQSYYLEREPLKIFTDAVTQSNHSSDGCSSCTELLCSIEPGHAVMKIQTRSDIAPVQAVVNVPLQTSCELGFAITISCAGLSNILNVLVPSEFIGFEVNSSNSIRVFSAMQNSILDDASDFSQIDTDSHYCLNSMSPGLLSNYIIEPISGLPCQLKLTSKHIRLLDNVYNIGRTNRQPEHSVVLYKFSEHGLFIELQSEEVCAHFQLSEVPSDVELRTVLSFINFKALKVITSKQWRAKKHASMLYADEGKMLIEHSAVNAQILCESLSKMFEKTKLSLSDKGFIEDDPHKLARILAKLDVASTSVDDVVKLQISEHTLEASINTETAVADLRINIKQAGSKKYGPAVEVKRLLLIACLKSFPQGQFVRIHGLLTDDPNIVIQSTVNNDFVVIAKMQHVDQAAA